MLQLKPRNSLCASALEAPATQPEAPAETPAPFADEVWQKMQGKLS